LGNRLPHDSVVLTIAFSPEGSHLATDDRAGILRVYDAANGELVYSRAAHPELLLDEIDVPAGVTAYAAHEPNSLPHGVRDVTWNPDGSRVVTAGGVFIRSFSAVDGELLHEIQVDRPTEGGDSRLVGRPSQIAFAGTDGLLTARTNRFIQRWNLDEDILVDEFEIQLSDIAGAFVSGGAVSFDFTDSFVAVSELDTLRLLDLTDGTQIVASVNLQTGTSAGNVSVSPDGRTAAMGGKAGIVLWALDGRELLAAAVPRAPGVNGAHVSTDGAYVSMYQGNTGATSWLWNISDSPAVSIQLPEDGQFDRLSLGIPGAVLGQVDAQLTTWALDGSEPVASFGTINNYSITVSPDGAIVSFGGGVPDRPLIHVLDIATGKSIVEPLPFLESLTEDGGFVLALAFSSDGRYLATSDADGQIIVRDPDSYQPLQDPLVGGGAGFRTGGTTSPLVFSDDGQYLLSTIDKQGRLWDVQSGVPVGLFRSDEDVNIIPATNARFLPAAIGDRLVVYNLDVDQWFDIACAAAGRNMTEDEWTQFEPSDDELADTCPQWAQP
jgi:WD40 repeat protein